MTKSKGFTLIELMIVIAIIAIIAAIAIPGILSATRAANERNASGSLKQMGSAEITFKTTDADQNGISDYWTADVAGLHWISTAATASLYPTALGGIQPRRGIGGIQLVEVSIALADSNTMDLYNGAAQIVHQASPKSSYWYQYLTDYETGPAIVTAYGPRHADRFGFIAWPHSYGSGGRQVFIISEGNTQFRKDPGSEAAFLSSGKPTVGSTADTSGALTTLYDTFPVNPTGAATAEAEGTWGKMD